MTDTIVSIVHTRLRLPTETLLKGMQAGIQLELHYEWLGEARQDMWVGLASFTRNTVATSPLALR